MQNFALWTLWLITHLMHSQVSSSLLEDGINKLYSWSEEQLRNFLLDKNTTER